MPKKYRPKKKNNKNNILILIGVIVIIFLVLLIKPEKNQSQTASPNDGLPADQLKQALSDNQPTLAFYHSNNCYQCIEMIKIVEQVFPEFSESIILVDINVYDERNTPLLRQVGLQYIPTLIFYDKAGREETSVGVMEAEQLRQKLAALVE
ncbi:MAG: thioredoxin family protein [Chloroflexi bacterium]|nr:thioredoxin family protein [Chloroflexota bacterium]